MPVCSPRGTRARALCRDCFTHGAPRGTNSAPSTRPSDALPLFIASPDSRPHLAWYGVRGVVAEGVCVWFRGWSCVCWVTYPGECCVETAAAMQWRQRLRCYYARMYHFIGGVAVVVAVVGTLDVARAADGGGHARACGSKWCCSLLLVCLPSQSRMLVSYPRPTLLL